MKTARRHELRENELAQQLGSLPDRLREHGLTIGLVAAVVVVAVVGFSMYSSSRAEAISETWRTINQGPSDAKTPEDRMARYREIADQNISPTATALALKAAADQAVAAMDDARLKGDAATAKRYRDQAGPLYQQIVQQHDSVLAIGGAARLGLAYLAEDAGDYGAAQQMYQTLMKESRFAGTPYASQAEFREKQLGKWKIPVVFAPASRPATMPAATRTAATQPVAVPMTLPQMRAATQPSTISP